MIYKGNKHRRSPSSYPPISLANSIYKLYTLQIRQSHTWFPPPTSAIWPAPLVHPSVVSLKSFNVYIPLHPLPLVPRFDRLPYSLQRGALPTQPLIIVLSATADLHSTFETIFQYIPWTFSANNPLPGIEYADDTVLMSRSQETLLRLLHLLQSLAMQMVSF